MSKNINREFLAKEIKREEQYIKERKYVFYLTIFTLITLLILNFITITMK